MTSNLDRAKPKPDRRAKTNNAQCTFCRKCYNSGLCMMPWPGLPVVPSKEVFNIGHRRRRKNKD
ncbi:MAG: hypothetical protein A2Z29_04420 [Chloroflexi bacterium RBG_16_56_11]|nr:MAG: hypothetical protein A2Z29_04420 [Chloroflexi bacterium RBG_16_56_11]